MTLDASGDIILDADGADFRYKDAGTEFLRINNGASGPVLLSPVSDKDLIFKGNDGGSEITALTLDMSDAGTAIFNHDITLPDDGKAIFGAGSDLQIYHDGSHSYVQDTATGHLRLSGNDLQLVNTAVDANYIICSNGGAVDLYYNNSKKLETTSSGIDVTGTITSGAITTAKDSNTFTVQSTDAGQASVDIKNTEGHFRIITDAGELKVFDQTDTRTPLVIDTSGNVGIGNTSPSAVVHAKNTTSAAQIKLSDATNTTEFQVAAEGFYFNNPVSNGTFIFRNGTGYTERMRINSSGNVGIGTASPSQKLTVNGATFITSSLTSPGSAGSYTYNGTAIDYLSNGTRYWSWGDATNRGTFAWYQLESDGQNQINSMTLDTSGRLGIGTTSPTTPLTVNNNTDHSDIAIFHAGGGTPNRGLKISTFSNTDSNAGVELDAQHSSGAFKFSTGGSERARIDSSGAAIASL